MFEFGQANKPEGGMTLPILRRLVQWPQFPYFVVVTCTLLVARFFLPNLSRQTLNISYAMLFIMILVSSCAASFLSVKDNAEAAHFLGFLAMIGSVFLQSSNSQVSLALLILGSGLLSMWDRRLQRKCSKSPKPKERDRAPQFSTFL